MGIFSNFCFEIWQLRRREKAKAEIAGELYLFLTPY